MADATEELASSLLAEMGAGPALVLGMRLVLLIGQERTETPGMLEAVKEAIAAIKRVGAVAGSFELS